jgi:hypothetical protein
MDANSSAPCRPAEFRLRLIIKSLRGRDDHNPKLWTQYAYEFHVIMGVALVSTLGATLTSVEVPIYGAERETPKIGGAAPGLTPACGHDVLPAISAEKKEIKHYKLNNCKI